MTLTRAAALGLAALAGFAAVVITIPGQATAATAYRYWAYYLGHGTGWQYSSRGPASEYPVDGDVEGWRFGIQADATNGLAPRAAPDFRELCASSPPRPGELRIGIVIDFGLATDAPAGERPPAGVVPGCVYISQGESDMAALEVATAVRIGTGSDVGLVCGVDGYPKTECAVAVTTHPAAPTAPPTAAPTAAPPVPTPARTTHPAAPPTQPVSKPPPLATPATTARPAATAPPSTADESAITSAQQSAPQSATDTASSAPVPAQAAPSSAGHAPATSLAALRSNSRHHNAVPVATVAGIALIVILGAGAVWRARVRGR